MARERVWAKLAPLPTCVSNEGPLLWRRRCRSVWCAGELATPASSNRATEPEFPGDGDGDGSGSGSGRRKTGIERGQLTLDDIATVHWNVIRARRRWNCLGTIDVNDVNGVVYFFFGFFFFFNARSAERLFRSLGLLLCLPHCIVNWLTR